MTTYSARDSVDDDPDDGSFVVIRRIPVVAVSKVVLTDHRVSRDARLLYALMCILCDADSDDEEDDALRRQMGLNADEVEEFLAELVKAGYLEDDGNGWTIVEPRS